MPRAWAVFKTAWGWMGLAASPRGIAAIVLPHPTKCAALTVLSRLEARRKGASENPSRLTSHVSRVTESRLRRARAQMVSFLAGRRQTLAFPVDFTGGTPFQTRVWRTIRAVPYGQVRSYKWVATRVGGARYARAVGLALGANPVPLIVPCHRVIAADGSLGGFSGGLPIKRRLLALEGTLPRTGRSG
ncbi:MAG: methylated-DNA--[protein]-cysteine S-methyltransferase [Nitrospirota bacterium]